MERLEFHTLIPPGRMMGHIFQSIKILALMLLLSPAATAQPPVTDLLLYDAAGSLTVYNPATSEKFELPVAAELRTIQTSGDGRIAYFHANDVWVLDVLNAPNDPINISQMPAEQEWWLDWTPDGKLHYQVGSIPGPYLLYTYDGHEAIARDYGFGWHWNEQGWYVAESTDGWYVWNGSERIDLMLPVESVWQTVEWTPDNHLFITVGYQQQEYAQPIGPTDIFYWNGSDVRKVDHPSDDETLMVGEWSADGRLTLHTSRDWYIWDGISFTADGVPDTATLTAIDGPAESIRDADWMPDGRLAIVADGDPASNSFLGHAFTCADPCAPQVYVWDRQTLHQVTFKTFGGFLVDAHDNGSIAVSDYDGLRIHGVTVFDSSLQPVFQSRAPHFNSRWSADGSLAYCSGDGLQVWNGEESTPLSSRGFSVWLLASAPSMTCSTG